MWAYQYTNYWSIGASQGVADQGVAMGPAPQPIAPPPGGATGQRCEEGARVQGVRLLLTYACPVQAEDNPIPEKEDLLAFLKMHQKYKASIISKEKHKNGKHHYHALVAFTSKVDLKWGRQFDFMGVHPNVEMVKKFLDCINYVTKDGNFLEDGINATKKGNDKKKDSVALSALEIARTIGVDEAESHMAQYAAADYLKNRIQMRGTFTHVRSLANPSETAVKIKTTGWKPIVDAWDITTHRESVVRPGRINDYMSTWVLEGGAGYGKTQCAAYLLQKAGCKNIRIVRTPEQFKSYFNADKTIDGVVFDELNVNACETRGGRWGYEEMIVLIDQEIGGPLRCRNEDVILEASVKRIITTNCIARALDMEKDQIRRRVHHVVVDDFLFE